MKRCLQIACNGLGTTRPNPMVGAIVVLNDRIIGEGFTSPYGGAHAEVNAINSVENQNLLAKATLYVTLEPCSHFGKTPPCSDLIIKKQIPRVVIGCKDDSPHVAGKGIEKLKASGCEVVFGVLEDDCKKHHKRFLTFFNKNRPHIILKWAETKDGFIAPHRKDEKKPVWITNMYSRLLVHKWRAEEQAILVGTNTVIEDNPSLTVRDWTGRNPLRIVLDKNSELNKTLTVFNSDSKTLLITEDESKFISNKKWTIYPPENASYFINDHLSKTLIDWSESDNIAKQICEILINRSINSIIIEGGTRTLQTFIDEGLWDEARIFVGDIEFKEGVKAPRLNGTLVSKEKILNDVLSIYENN